jgi:uncharacterized protein (DUF111 family)
MGKIAKFSLEYRDVKRIAGKRGLPIQKVRQELLKHVEKKMWDKPR